MNNEQEPKCERCRQLELDLSICRAALAHMLAERKPERKPMSPGLAKWFKDRMESIRRSNEYIRGGRSSQ